MIVSPRFPATFSMPPGHLLLVTADADSRGCVWDVPPSMYAERTIRGWATPEQQVLLGPFTEPRSFRVEATVGTVQFTTQPTAQGPRTMQEDALEKVDAAVAATAPAKRAPTPGSFAAGIRAMMDEARAGIVQARAEGLVQVQEAVAKLGEAKVATKQVAQQMAKTIHEEAADVMAELGQISNMPPE